MDKPPTNFCSIPNLISHISDVLMQVCVSYSGIIAYKYFDDNKLKDERHNRSTTAGILRINKIPYGYRWVPTEAEIRSIGIDKVLKSYQGLSQAQETEPHISGSALITLESADSIAAYIQAGGILFKPYTFSSKTFTLTGEKMLSHGAYNMTDAEILSAQFRRLGIRHVRDGQNITINDENSIAAFALSNGNFAGSSRFLADLGLGGRQ